ncbi:hypothetical protein RHSIM_Rhsim02G0246100 [Rhododendron simsii]|uniref:Uncharacterized protein n=1 Tax=Rhododendron simsii TaxID=118357 RepID=A0A834HES2_RHOSS|nr:hypothetical protein RHSIM_Rhsim02G0246100 [Rhododendron simsii]
MAECGLGQEKGEDLHSDVEDRDESDDEDDFPSDFESDDEERNFGSDDEDDFPPDFEEYMGRELKYSRLTAWVFWNRQDDDFTLSDGKEYHSFYADAECALELPGLPGRVFLRQLPESNPDISMYNPEEYPQQDLAERCGIEESLGLPVFERSSHTCVGVLEMVSLEDKFYELEFLGRMYDLFQEFDLRCFDGYKHCKMQYPNVTSHKNNGMYFVSEAQNDNLPSLDSLQNGKVTTQVDLSNQPSVDASSNGQNVVTAERNIFVVSSSKEHERKTQDRKHKKGGPRIDIPKEEILECSHMNREDAGAKLRGKSTLPKFKIRVCLFS